MRYNLVWLSLLFLLISTALAGLFGSPKYQGYEIQHQKQQEKNPQQRNNENQIEESAPMVPVYGYQDDLISDEYLPQKPPIPGSSLQTRRRPLGSWSLADFLLVGTVDGSLHARDRKTGMELWSIPGEGPLVQVSRAENISESQSHETELTWIVEPMGDGALYYFTEMTGLRRMPVSIKQLVAESPFAINGDDKIYTGNRHTTLYSINATTGDILRVFGGEQDSLGKPECKAHLDSDLDYDFEDEDENATRGSFMIGKTGEFPKEIKDKR